MQMTDSRKHQYIRYLIDKLQDKCPVSFPKKPLPKVPLALGSVKVIQAVLNIPYDTADQILKWWCQGKRYEVACCEGASRYRLDGTVFGSVTKKQAKCRNKLPTTFKFKYIHSSVLFTATKYSKTRYHISWVINGKYDDITYSDYNVLYCLKEGFWIIQA